MTRTIRTSAKLKNKHMGWELSDDKIEELQLHIHKPNLIYIQNMPSITNIMSDLTPILLRNTSNWQFITSDCPVTIYNQLFANRNYIRNYGYGQIGIQCFLPISPRLCLVLIDSAVYSFNCDEYLVITINEPDQIIELNKLFVNNARRAIYFNNSEKQWKIEKIAKLKKSRSNNFGNKVFGNEKQGYLILHSKVSVHCKVKLPKFNIKPEFMPIPFPPHAAGPIRPTVILAEDEDK